MQTLVANFSGKTRRVTFDGREFVVAPITMIVPGVLPGSRGPILYEEKDIATNFQAWNYMPIVNNHPVDQSGRCPEVIEKSGLGFVFNTTVDGKLKAEGWFDVVKCNQIDLRIIPLVENGSKVELSTGLYIDIEDVAGIHNGKNYAGVARNYRPDHLALLLDDKGACSVDDGCGVNNAEKKEQEELTPKSIWVKLGEILGVTNDSPSIPSIPATNSSQTENENMSALTKEQRTELISGLITNCSCGTWKEEDRPALEAMSDKALNGLKTAQEASKKDKQLEALTNAARKGFMSDGVEYILNDKNELVKKEATTPTTNTTTKVEDKKELSMQDLPIEVQNQIAYGARAMQRDKEALVAKLIANHKDEATKNARKEALLKLELTELEDRVQDLPVVENKESARPSYFGSAMPIENTKKEIPVNDDEMLGVPAWNFDSEN